MENRKIQFRSKAGTILASFRLSGTFRNKAFSCQLLFRYDNIKSTSV